MTGHDGRPVISDGAKDSGAQPLLRVDDLAVAFGRGKSAVEVVNGLSFSINEGETLALVGESGSGKSVSALAAVGLIEARGGRVATGSAHYSATSGESVDFARGTDSRLRRLRGLEIGMIFQDPMTSLNPLFRIGDQISEAARLHQGLTRRQGRALAIEMLKRVRIPDAERRLDQYPHELSGGMRQRVMIATALSCNPRLLIADEPTTALDVTVQAEILLLIKQLQQETGTAVLFISHDLSVVSEISDKIIIMRNGRKVEEGTTEEVLLRPHEPYTQMLLSAVPRLGETAGKTGPVRIAVTGGVPTASRPANDATDRSDVPGSAAPGQPLLRVENLTKRFEIRRGPFRQLAAVTHAVESVSFEIAAGETLSLVGESGSGKSTTGRCILRLIEPDSGRVTMGGTDILALSGREMTARRRDMQIVFQDPYASLNPRKTAADLVGEPLLIHQGASGSLLDDQVESLFRRVGLLPEHRDRYPHEFSGGQRQRIGIARAIALKPKLIVGDEPVSALDVSIRAQIVNLMIDLQEEFGISYLFISHDMAVVERMSHRIAVMRAGQIVEIGARGNVLADPKHAYTRSLMAAVPTIDPGRRNHHAALSVEVPRSAMRPPGWNPPPLHFESAGDDHAYAVEEPERNA
ncbi:ABC transporter ATP-binding protein [Oceanibacterium hippocampi]|uniref:Glutathione import ATP-binding protein GsiA n=1 Tax=Oceanibacterium hippocampi TaxID=745714 RepID=A0A1Y5U2W7_9PROT|nr:ABC transporter ATP-binding protein [Oceanibacterium hippocampi]SLN75561.1 Glutathione import ATP-binding protein GsiA [Oceanibacterium hippocampi]